MPPSVNNDGLKVPLPMLPDSTQSPHHKMAQSIPYPIHYMPQHAQYYLAPHPQHPHVPGQMHIVGPTTRPEQPQRKRPKYTRSKTGCLTCRMKKIKCDETKPSCQRCTHGQRDCTWPENAPPKKKAPTRKNSATDDRPSTADSLSHVSDGSSASRETGSQSRGSVGVDMSVNGLDRRHSEPLVHSFALSSVTNGRRKTLANIGQDQPANGLSPPMLSTVPEMASSSYPSPSSSSYSAELAANNSVVHSRNNSRPSTANSLSAPRFHTHSGENGQFNPAPLLTSLDPIEPYVSMPSYQTSRYLPSNSAWTHQFQGPQDRNLLADHLPREQRSRLQ